MVKFMSAVAVIVVAFACQAQAKVLECKTSSDDWVSSPYVFGYEDGESTAIIYDPVIHTFVGEPISGKVEETAKKVVFNWTVQVKVRGDQTRMTYRASYFLANGQFTVRATPGAGYTSNFEGRGSCVVKK